MPDLLPPTDPPVLSEKSAEHLRLLAMFHVVVAILIFLCGCTPILHIGVGGFLLISHSGPNQTPPPAVTGGLFFVAGLIILAALWSMAAAMSYAAKCLRERKHWMYCLVIAGILCSFAPLGTILGVFTIIVLVRDDVKAAFLRTP